MEHDKPDVLQETEQRTRETAFAERMAQLRAQEAKEQAQQTERQRQDYLRRTGRKAMRP